MFWINFIHIYQPPNWPKSIIIKVARESYRPILKILSANPKLKITLNITGSLTEQLTQNGLNDILYGIKKLAKRGQIEFTESAKYHPILPLLPPHEMKRQIFLNNQINKKYFGKIYKPIGFYPPEMAVSPKLLKIISKLKYEWIIADEICYNGKIRQVNFDQKYKIKNSNINIFFRNRIISNYLYFESNLNSTNDFWQKIKQDNRSRPYLIIGLDGETLGHHRPGLDKYWQKLVNSENVKTITLSELYYKLKKTKIFSLKSGSWSSRESEIKNKNLFVLWNDSGNQIHKNLWQLTYLTIKTIENNNRDLNFAKARVTLDKSLYSDPYWWASAKPWWDKKVVDKGARNLLECLYTLKNKPKKGLILAEKLYYKIIKLTGFWQKSGKAERMTIKYLKHKEDSIRYLGGQKITN